MLKKAGNKINKTSGSPNGDRHKTKKTTIGNSPQTKRRHGRKHRQDSQPHSNRGQGF